MSGSSSPKLIVTFRSDKIELALDESSTVEQVKSQIVSLLQERQQQQAKENDSNDDGGNDQHLLLLPSDIKLLFKGKVIAADSNDNDDKMLEIMTRLSQKKKVQKSYRIIATGMSSVEVDEMDKEITEGMEKVMRERAVKDDLSEAGKRDMLRQKRLGNRLLRTAAAQENRVANSGGRRNEYKFDRIETLSGLPDEKKAKEILTALANDPGILECMKKNKWRVGSLAELYPEGKVGETAVCVMGLNKNKGQQILLRIRTDDLQGFRKIQSIRKVLYHELAHNVYSEHDDNFFQLMRQIEKECVQFDWTKGKQTNDLLSASTNEEGIMDYEYTGGAYRLGGGNDNDNNNNTEGKTVQHTTKRELLARAAVARMTQEEIEIEQNCGCIQHENIFLPKSSTATTTNSRIPDDVSTNNHKNNNNMDMDIS